MTRSIHRKAKRLQIEGQFVAHRREMRESPAWGALTWNARQILDRLELEHMAHGGAENGKLICTYAQLVEAGMRGPSIAEAINICEALGFLEVTKRGAPSRSSYRSPSTYRLTYLNGRTEAGDISMATDEWARIKTAGMAQSAVAAARAKKSPQHVTRAKASSNRQAAALERAA